MRLPRRCPLELRGGRLLHVRSHIDRIDVEESRTLVRDLKTGRAHPRPRVWRRRPRARRPAARTAGGVPARFAALKHPEPDDDDS